MNDISTIIESILKEIANKNKAAISALLHNALDPTGLKSFIFQKEIDKLLRIEEINEKKIKTFLNDLGKNKLDITSIVEAIIGYKLKKDKTAISDLLHIALDDSAANSYSFTKEIETLLRTKDLDVKSVLAFISNININTKHSSKAHSEFNESYTSQRNNKNSKLDEDLDSGFDYVYPDTDEDSLDKSNNELMPDNMSSDSVNDVATSDNSNSISLYLEDEEKSYIDEINFEDDAIEKEINKILNYNFLNPIEQNIYLINYDKLLIKDTVKKIPIRVFLYYLKQADIKIKMHKALQQN
jgi:hypothetical protein